MAIAKDKLLSADFLVFLADEEAQAATAEEFENMLTPKPKQKDKKENAQ
jgi:hypothetical protein